MDLFDPKLPFFKGNLHCHTTVSDGKLSPDEVVALYRDLGYDFLALTDHRRLSAPTHLEGCMLLLSGMEMDYTLPGEVLHLIGVGMDERLNGYNLSEGPQRCINLFRRCGGRAIVAHPAWSLNTVATLSALQNVTAAEIYNSVSTYPWNGDRADASGVLDVAAAHGALYRFVASDDSHRYQGEAGRAFTMVQAEDLSQESLFDALDRGRFYCSQGPRFEQISVEDGRIDVTCSPVDTVIFYSNLIWTGNRCQTGKDSGLCQLRPDRQPRRALRSHTADRRTGPERLVQPHFAQALKAAVPQTPVPPFPLLRFIPARVKCNRRYLCAM